MPSQLDGIGVWPAGAGEGVDELQLKVNPVLLGSGLPLVRGICVPASFRLVHSEQLPGGVLLNTYRKGCGVAGSGRG